MPETASLANARSIALARATFVYSIELTVILAAAAAAFLLRFDFSIPPSYVPVLGAAILVWAPVKLATFRLMGLDRRWARYASMSDLMRIAASNVLGSVVSLLLLLLLQKPVPRSIYAIDLLLCVTMTAGLRVTVRLLTDLVRPRTTESHQATRKTIIYGAGNAGASLLRDLEQHAVLNYAIIGFVDDSPRKQGLILQGVPVLGTGADLTWIAKNQHADLILVAVPSASGGQMRRIFERCTAAGIPYKTIPGVAELMEGGLASQIRDVAVEDLLGRTPVNLEQDRISQALRGKVVLVTGAAGSIGSEICRQIARFEPTMIIGFDIAESPMFYLQQELERTMPNVQFRPEIGSVQNKARLRDTFDMFQPTVVYHAAAYKHVPLMEMHTFEAIENNVFGTLNVVQTARDFGVKEFVMISSDKAVRPANVMGATKRVAELLVRSLQPPDGRYVSVRFGNVLGSNGSVVPIFKDQIVRGGPVTVTHPDMTRYFMTIPEACQLVLQASIMGRGGEIFVLDMGEPVKIVELAKNLILLSGLRPDVDIRIEFTGMRPGEKLTEELSALEEGLLKTHHEKIMVFAGVAPPWEHLHPCLTELSGACRERDIESLIRGIRGFVPEYSPGPHLTNQTTRELV